MKIRDILRKHSIELEGPLGHGQQGEVFRAKRLARDGRTAMPCAVKIYPFADTLAERPTKLLEEIQLQVQLHDSNFVVRLLDVIVEETFIALVLDECQQTFADLLEARQSDRLGVGLPRAECYRICEQIARGLSDCHSVNVIHGDVKPHNMLLTRRGWAKLCDFGTARVEQSLSFLTSRVGTLAFMLPRHREELTRDRDLFGLALSYAYLRLGQHPFRNSDPVTEQFDLAGLDDDEINTLRPILADERISASDIHAWFRQLDPVVRLSQVSAGLRSSVVEHQLNRFRSRYPIRDLIPPDMRDVDDLLDALTMWRDLPPEEQDSAFAWKLGASLLFEIGSAQTRLANQCDAAVKHLASVVDMLSEHDDEIRSEPEMLFVRAASKAALASLSPQTEAKAKAEIVKDIIADLDQSLELQTTASALRLRVELRDDNLNSDIDDLTEAFELASHPLQKADLLRRRALVLWSTATETKSSMDCRAQDWTWGDEDENEQVYEPDEDPQETSWLSECDDLLLVRALGDLRRAITVVYKYAKSSDVSEESPIGHAISHLYEALATEQMEVSLEVTRACCMRFCIHPFIFEWDVPQLEDRSNRAPNWALTYELLEVLKQLGYSKHAGEISWELLQALKVYEQDCTHPVGNFGRSYGTIELKRKRREQTNESTEK